MPDRKNGATCCVFSPVESLTLLAPTLPFVVQNSLTRTQKSLGSASQAAWQTGKSSGQSVVYRCSIAETGFMCQPQLALPCAALFGTQLKIGQNANTGAATGPRHAPLDGDAWLWKWLKWWLTVQTLVPVTRVYITLSSLH